MRGHGGRRHEAGRGAFVVVFILLAIDVHVVGGQPAPHQQGQQDSEPAQRPAVPGAVVGDGGGGGLDGGKGGAASQYQLDVPGHQLEMALAADFAPDDKHR